MPSLDPDAVHLWVIDVASTPHVPDVAVREAGRAPHGSWRACDALRAMTSVAERERAARFKRPADGDRYLVAHGALRQILAGYLCCDPDALAFTQEAHGKPFIEGTPVHFNLSHSASLALVAVARSRPVGVDVERERDLPDWDHIAAQVCSPAERRELEAVHPQDRLGAFFALWTRKEALAKLTGEGLRALSRDACLAVASGSRFEHVMDLPGYAACVAAQGTDWRLVRCAPPPGFQRIP